jgi:hypothetical protein
MHRREPRLGVQRKFGDRGADEDQLALSAEMAADEYIGRATPVVHPTDWQTSHHYQSAG